MLDFHALARRFSTPLYVYDFDKIKANFLAYKDAFSARKSLICYALKANPNLFILRQIADLDGGADCVSIGEIRRALLAGIKPYRIIFSGVGKTNEEIKEALKLGILFLNVESRQELLRIERIARKLNLTARISIRVNPDIDAKTHPYISTGLSENKFGVDINEAKELYLYAYKSPDLAPIAIHFHIGSQLMELEPILESARKIAHLARSLLALGMDLRFFDVGGGIGIAYEGETPLCLQDYAQGILQALSGLDLTIICEPGRSIVGDSGILLVSVIGEKRHQHKRFVIVDGAMNDLIRPSLYQAHHEAILVGQERAADLMPTDIVGPICESGDFLAKNIPFPACREGDLIIFKNTGAYGYSMSSNYNSRPKSAEVGLLNQQAILIKPRQSLQDLYKDEQELLSKFQGESDAQ